MQDITLCLRKVINIILEQYVLQAQKEYDALKLKAENYNSALIYTGLKKPNQKKWSYTLTTKQLSIGASDWGVLIGNFWKRW